MERLDPYPFGSRTAEILSRWLRQVRLWTARKLGRRLRATWPSDFSLFRTGKRRLHSKQRRTSSAHLVRAALPTRARTPRSQTARFSVAVETVPSPTRKPGEFQPEA